MNRSSPRTAERARALAAFGLAENGRYRQIRDGTGGTIFTIGYERRDGEGLLSELTDAGVDVLLDVRDKPFSRRADFRRAALAETCSQAGVAYECCSDLGSTEHQRTRLRETGNLSEFRRRFRDHAARRRVEVLDELAGRIRGKSVALLCYERGHDDCHRSIVADLLADRTGAAVVAIM